MIVAGVLGLGGALTVSFISIQLDSVGQRIHPQVEKEKVSNMASGFYNTSGLLSELVAPLIGGFIYQYLGFNNLFLIIGIIGLLIVSLYFTIGKAYTLFIINDNYNDLEEDQEMVIK